MSWWKKLLNTLGIGLASHSSSAATAPVEHDTLDAVIRAREAAYYEYFGELPADILKMADLMGRWPGGGIYKIRHNTPDGVRWIYISSGLANPGIPVTHGDSQVNHDEHGRIDSIHATVQGTGETLPATGFGYEILLISETEADWPLIILQWAIHAEFKHRVGLLDRVLHYEGVTVSDIPIGEEETVNLLIHRAQPPLPEHLVLPNGHIPLLVITTITHEEMNWSLQEGRQALLEALLASDVGQISRRQRASVVD